MATAMPVLALLDRHATFAASLSRQGPEVLRWCAYEAGKAHARASAPDHACRAGVKDRTDGKRAAISEARKIIRRACRILAELGDDALTTT
jgi:transposase